MNAKKFYKLWETGFIDVCGYDLEDGFILEIQAGNYF